MSGRSPWREDTALDPREVAFDLDGGDDAGAHHLDDAASTAGAPSGGPSGAPGPRSDRRGRWVRWPDAAPAWVRGPGAVVVAVVLAVALTAALGLRGAAARVEEQVATRTALLSLAAGMEVSFDGAGSRTSAGATRTVEAALTLVNRGDREVRVRLTGMSPPALPVLGGVEEVTVAAQDRTVVTVPLEVDCATVPALRTIDYTEPAERPREWVEVTVAGLEGGDDTGRLPLIEAHNSLGIQMAQLCDPMLYTTSIGEVVEAREDGALRVRLTNEGEETLRLITSTPFGINLVVDPPLDDGLAGGTSTDVVLTARVDCSRPVDLLELRPVVDFSAVGDQWQSPVLDDSVLIAWVASRVTATCG